MLIAAHGLSASQPDPVAHNAMEMLVATEWLSQHIDDSDLVVLDCTILMQPDEGGCFLAVSGRTDY